MNFDGSTLSANQVTRWLGVMLDRKLSFLTHTKNWAHKGVAVAAHLHRLNNTVKGAPPHLIRQAVKACVLPIAFYGAEAWWPGDFTLRWKRKKLQIQKHRSGQHLKMLSKAITLGLRAILPVYRTVPIPALHREAGIPTAHTILKEIRLGRALRIQTLDFKHPLRRKAYSSATTRLTEITHLLPKSTDSDLACLDNITCRTPETIQPTLQDILLYTDGASTADGRAGGAYVLFQGGRKILAQKFCINRKVEPIDTEIIAIREGLRVSIEKAFIRFATNIIVYTDNMAAAKVVNGKDSPTSREDVLMIRKFQREWELRRRLPHLQAGRIAATWIPSHSGIRGNELADRLAKRGAQEALLNQSNEDISHAAVKQLLKEKKAEIEKDWWLRHCPETYRTLRIELQPPGQFPNELRLPRRALGLLLAARTGHGDFAEYHNRFHHENSTDCSCGRAKTKIHFYFCKETRARVKKEVGKRKPQEGIDWLLGSAEGAKAFGRIMK